MEIIANVVDKIAIRSFFSFFCIFCIFVFLLFFALAELFTPPEKCVLQKSAVLFEINASPKSPSALDSPPERVYNRQVP